MKIRIAACAIALLFLIAFTDKGRAGSSAGYSGVNLNIRSGPSGRFPAVGVVGAGSPLIIRGCLLRYTWCDIGASGVRGWASGANIQFVHEARRVYVPAYAAQVGIPIITFNLTSYWNDYYRDYSFYSEVNHWNDHQWENDGNPPGWRDNWNDDYFDHEY